MLTNNIYNFVKDNISFSKKLDGNKTIKEIRNILIKRENAYIEILKDDVFLDIKNQRNILSKEHEKQKRLSEIADEENYVYLQSSNSKNEKSVELRLNNNFFKESKYFDSTILMDFRKKERIKKNIVFTRNNNIIDFPEEKDFKIIDIIEEENEKKIINLLETITIEKIKSKKSIERNIRKYQIIFQNNKQSEITDINAEYNEKDNNNNKCEEVNDQIEKINDNLKEMNNQIGNNNNKYEEVNDQIKTINDNLKEMNNQIGNNNNKCEEVNDQIKKINDNLKEMNDQIGNNNKHKTMKSQSEKEKNNDYFKMNNNNNLSKTNNRSTPNIKNNQNVSLENNITKNLNKSNNKNEINDNKIQSNIDEKDNFKVYYLTNSDLNEVKDIKSIIIMGDSQSGKTSFINTFVNFIEKNNYKLKRRAKVIKAKENEIKIYEFKLKNNLGLRIIKTPGLQLDDKDQEIFDKLEIILAKYQNINAICITVPGSFIRLDDEKKLLFNKIIDFYGENFYNNILFIMTFSDSDPHIDGLKLLKKNNKSFVETYLKEPWCFNFDLSSTYSEENNGLIKDKYSDDYKMSGLFFEKIKQLSQKKYISKKHKKNEINISIIQNNFQKYIIFFFYRYFYEIYKNNCILSQIKNNYEINNNNYLYHPIKKEIKLLIIDIVQENTKQQNLLCEDCQCTCFYNYNYNYNGNCLFCPSNCKHITKNKEYTIKINEISMSFQDFFYQNNIHRIDEYLKQIKNLIYNLRKLLFTKFNEIKKNIESKNIKFDYPLDNLIRDIKNSISMNKYSQPLNNELNELMKLKKINNF